MEVKRLEQHTLKTNKNIIGDHARRSGVSSRTPHTLLPSVLLRMHKSMACARHCTTAGREQRSPLDTKGNFCKLLSGREGRSAFKVGKVFSETRSQDRSSVRAYQCYHHGLHIGSASAAADVTAAAHQTCAQLQSAGWGHNTGNVRPLTIANVVRKTELDFSRGGHAFVDIAHSPKDLSRSRSA